MNGSRPDRGDFEDFAASYDDDLHRGLSLSGEDKEYFARRRIAWTAHRIGSVDVRIRRVLDYGCGSGAAIPLLLSLLKVDHVTGVDVSASLLNIAAQRHHGMESRVRFSSVEALVPDGTFDLVYTTGVFHHIRPEDRPAVIDYILRALRPGGLLAFWENNPWNPGTRLVMARIPFDRNAITLRPPESRRLLRSCGFEILRTDFLFVFPKLLAPLRLVEPMLSGLPIGAQYLVLSRRVD